MADARSLLRQQRAARRIDHPHATYSDSGKLTCTICHEPIKSEAQWEGHTRGVGHRQRLLAYQKSRQPQQQKPTQPPSYTSSTNGGASASKSKSKNTISDADLLAQIIAGNVSDLGSGQKRKHDEAGSDVEMDDAEAEEEAMRKKRSKTTEIDSPTTSKPTAAAANNGRDDSVADKDAGKPTSKITPPSLVRRISGTPSHGVELQIPSRPATPSASGTSAASTPRATSMGRSPLMPPEVQSGGLPAKQSQKAAFATTTSTNPVTSEVPTSSTAAVTTADDEDDDWAAFEAETSKRTKSAGAYASDAVISAAPLTAEELAAKIAEEEHERRRAVADIELEDEKEEATRALETEFEEMEELEARVRRLKERREALRKGSMQSGNATIAAAEVAPNGNDDAGGFRFRG
ncbi:hypothetical protein VSDG_09555 [Cytospora chrysosperma]|uniref:Coiled-coil domain-containing protein 16 n=1 Tax=Cytospora chrysosperma TaxID=252740 RepID=A0A423VAC6_CYTCH|nr:hypothetical protein VSDG_09555 [Valsa sordida]